MNLISKIVNIVNKEHSFLTKVVILLMLTRFMYLEDNTLALIAEILGSLAVIVSGVSKNRLDLEED